MLFSVVNKQTLIEDNRYSADAPIEWAGMGFSTHDHIAIPETIVTTPIPSLYNGRRKLTKLEFIELIGDPAYQAILSMSHTSVEVESEVKKFELATPDPDGTSVLLDDVRTISFIQSIGPVLVAQGIVTSGWVSEVLNG